MNTFATSMMRAAVAFCLACTAWPMTADAQGHDAIGQEWIAVDPSRLDALRGGFVTPSGLVLSFGIERTVFVNGELVASTRIAIPDVAAINAEQARELAKLQDTLRVQVGEGNVLEHTGTGGVVIQNTLDGQTIRAATTLDISVNTLGMFQELNTNAALQSAINSAASGP